MVKSLLKWKWKCSRCVVNWAKEKQTKTSTIKMLLCSFLISKLKRKANWSVLNMCVEHRVCRSVSFSSSVYCTCVHVHLFVYMFIAFYAIRTFISIGIVFLFLLFFSRTFSVHHIFCELSSECIYIKYVHCTIISYVLLHS